MEIKRRNFLAVCGSLVLGAAGSAHGLAPENKGKKLMIQNLTQELFEKYTGQQFTIGKPDGATVKLELVQVRAGRPQKTAAGAPRIESFSVFFEGAPETAMEQGSYTFSHPEMGTVEGLFMVPIVSAKPDIRTYEVSFSRIIEA